MINVTSLPATASDGRAFYNLFFHPLSKIPGPKLCAATDVSTHRRPLSMSSLHDKYGTVVRIGPNQLSFSSASSWRDIYGHSHGRKQFPKSHFYAFGTRHLINERDPQKHSEMKRKLSHGFSVKALQEQEDIVQNYVDKLIRQINVYATRPEGDEMVKWYNFFTFDLIGDLAFGESFGSLNDGIFFPSGLILGNIRAIAWRSVARWFPVFDKLGVWTVPKRVMEMRIKHSEYSRKMIIQRMNMKTTRRDLLSGQFGPDGPGMTIPELSGQASTIITAGSETIATFLSGTTYHLLKNPRVYNLLAEEIRSAYNSYEDITDINATKLKYLSAVIDEGLRVYPPVPIGLYRESPGETVDGIYIPKGVELSTSSWTTCRSPENFHSPEEFKPERWLDPECTDKKQASQPFSLGSRVCIGRNLALKEIRLLLSKMFWVYDMELVNKEVDINRDSTSFVLWNKPDLWVRFARRPGVEVPGLDGE
ncbi:cytochrome P450 [Choiromyces venosus 120613-1]|uniref:Cytochrome P450 n=1 Tax=Choiromyces venosus 120613-1 TaxID=1336337 RepID=A0A3N4JUF3_9PEZI|nr:cytochrome P450 [Choiromyces venosus 120613-1]